MVVADERLVAAERREINITIRAFEEWRKQLPQLREERRLREQQQFRIINCFRKVSE